MPEPEMVSWVAKAVGRERKDMAMIESMVDGVDEVDGPV